jgi:DNA-binding transcriptional MerR regulator
MKLQQLATEAATPVSTVKFYLREGLLAPGRKLNATTSAYGPEHVERLELIRALRQVVGLGLPHVRQVVEAVETMDPVPMMGRVQTIVLDLPQVPDGPGREVQPKPPGTSGERPRPAPGPASGPASGPAGPAPGALDIIRAMGWREGSPESIAALDEQLATMGAWGLAPPLDTILVYARAVDRVAEHELTVGSPWTGSDVPSNDRIATYTAVGIHAYSQLLLRLHSVAQGSYARARPSGSRRAARTRTRTVLSGSEANPCPPGTGIRLP